MPGGDRTGPMGMGSKTGRAGGYCMGYGMPGFASFGRGTGGFGGGFRRGYTGAGAGRRSWRSFNSSRWPGWMRFFGRADAYDTPPSYTEPDPGMEKRMLQSQSEALQNQLNIIQQRLNAMESKDVKQSEE